MKRFFFVLLSFSMAITAMAQQKVVADKIVGIVGDKIILQSDVSNAILDMQRQGYQVPDNAPCFIMDQLLTMKALVMQAEKDSIIVEDEELEALLDNQVRGFVNMYGSKEALEEIAGRTVYQIKEDLRQSYKERELAKRMREQIVSTVKITPQEVRAYWDKIPKDSLPFYESEVELGEIVVHPKASREFELLAMDELKEYKKEVEAGEQKFETLARLYSDDPAVKQNGGRYAINRNEKSWDPAFINNAFRLREGQISPVFKSAFGYHIILMESRAGDDAVVRHILRIPKITDVEINAAKSKLDSVRARLIAGTMEFGQAVDRFSDDDASKFTGGMHQCENGTFCTMDQLDKDLLFAVDGLKVGEYSQPQEYTDQQGKKGVRLVYLKSRTTPHRENMKDDYNRIAQRALEVKKQKVLEDWFAQKIPTYYLMVDKSYQNCEGLHNWLQYSVKADR